MKTRFLNLFAIIALPVLSISAWVIFGWTPEHSNLFFLLGAFAFWSLFASGILISRESQKSDYPDRFSVKGEFDDEPSLWTLNGIGTRFVGVSGNPFVKYQFFCFFYLPICPIGCYAAKSEGESYSWYGYAKWSILEVVGIYMKWWGGLLGVLFTLYSLCGWFSD